MKGHGSSEYMIKVCQNCSTEFDSRESSAKYCSRSCAAKKNNIGVRRHGQSPKKKCLGCENIVELKNRRYCLNICRAENFRRVKIEAGQTGICLAKNYLIQVRGNKCEQCGWCEINKKVVMFQLS